jgi:ornithine cyclodeaminase/alanine dehydrogenase-like protein (mu-crystallin family)
MIYLDEERVRSLLRWDALIDAMETALAAFSSGRVQQPVRGILTVEENKRYLGVMPAVTDEVMGAKLVSFYPGNEGTAFPTHNGVILLFDTRTGVPLAAMDGRLITEMRTAAVSAAATKYLMPENSRILAVLGSGVQARAHVEALAHVAEFAEIRVWSRTPEHARRFAREHGAIANGGSGGRSGSRRRGCRDQFADTRAARRMAQAGRTCQWRRCESAVLARTR